MTQGSPFSIWYGGIIGDGVVRPVGWNTDLQVPIPCAFSTDNGSVKRSWDLKVDRAEEHLEELRANVAAYDRSRPYEAVCSKPPAPDATEWSFMMNFTEPTPGSLAIVLGDLLFNLRSALDHVAVAIAPPAQKRSAGFPLCDRDNARTWLAETRSHVGAGSFVRPQKVTVD